MSGSSGRGRLAGSATASRARGVVAAGVGADPDPGQADRVLVAVRMEFVLSLHPGSEIPSPSSEAVEAAALCLAGPAQILPGFTMEIDQVSPVEGEARQMGSRPRAGRT